MQDTEAEYQLGMCYEYGWGVEANTAKAASLYNSAAKKDHAPALYSLGLFYEQGLGGEEKKYQNANLYNVIPLCVTSPMNDSVN